jgi:predicted transcriptional regulator
LQAVLYGENQMRHQTQQTSLDAYYEIQKEPGLGDKQRRVLSVIKDYPEGISNNELAHALHWPINQVVPRVYELRMKGLVVSLGRKVCLMTKRNVIAWGAK